MGVFEKKEGHKKAEASWERTHAKGRKSEHMHAHTYTHIHF